jgi:predicted amidohydrolase
MQPNEISVLLVQFPVSLSIAENMQAIEQALEHARPGELVLCPEGCISGYSLDLTFLHKIDRKAVENGLSELELKARRYGIHLWVGAIVNEDGNWRNAAFGFTPQGQAFTYYKVNLASHERGTFLAGNELPVFPIQFDDTPVRVGVQICRELRYPEQWGWLARQGAQVFLHLNNAIGNARNRGVWRSMLVSRAAETGRYVLSANNGNDGRQGPTAAIAPDGQMLGEIAHRGTGTLRVSIDLNQVTNWYVDQSRPDVVAIQPPPKMF